MLYRILTENKNRKVILDLTSKKFDGFTTYKAQGFWKGVSERSLIIEIVTNDEFEIKELCKEIRDYNKQECILLESFNTNVTFI